MPNKKLTDKEIVKALECCVGDPYTCGQCSYQEIKHYDYDNDMFEIMPNGIQYNQWSCDRWLLIDLLDLINRLQEENENYSKNNQQMTSDILALYKALKTAKTSAYKEFAERLKAVSHPYADTQMVFEVQIDNLLKEMVGEDK